MGKDIYLPMTTSSRAYHPRSKSFKEVLQTIDPGLTTSVEGTMSAMLSLAKSKKLQYKKDGNDILEII
jgi:hypothetical protein